MKLYRLSQETVARALQRVLIGAVVMSVAVTGCGIAIGFNSAQERGGFEPERVLSGVVTLLILLGVLIFGFVRMYRQQRKRLEAPQIELGEDVIARPAGMLPRAEIRRDEVTSIEEIDAGLCVIASEPRRAIVIPKGLEDYAQVREALGEWSAVKPLSPKVRWLNYLGGVGVIAAFGVLLISFSLWLLIPTGLAMIGLFGWLLWAFIRAKMRPGMIVRLGFGMVIVTLMIIGKIALVISLGNSVP